MKIKPKVWIGLFFCLLAVGLLLGDSWPAARSLVTLDVASSGFLESAGTAVEPLVTNGDGKIVLPAEYSVSLDLPANLRAGKAEPLRLTVEQKDALDNRSPLAGWQVNVESSLSFSDLDYRPKVTLLHRLASDDPAKFVWFLTGSRSSPDPGTLWVYLLFTSPQGGEPARVLVMARPLSFELQTFYDLPMHFIQIAAWVSFALGGAIILVTLFPRILAIWRKIC